VLDGLVLTLVVELELELGLVLAPAPLLLVLSEEQAPRASEAAAPTTSRPIALLRMGNSAFHGAGSTMRLRSPVDHKVNVVGGNISPMLPPGKEADTELLPSRGIRASRNYLA
jgi:hypothetical protein